MITNTILQTNLHATFVQEPGYGRILFVPLLVLSQHNNVLNTEIDYLLSVGLHGLFSYYKVIWELSGVVLVRKE